MEKKWTYQLTDKTLVRSVSMKGFDLEIHVISNYDSPEVIQEINRISAKGFGLKKDGDEFDKTYKYICVYDPVNQEINGFYRYILCRKAISAPNFHTSVRLATAKFYNFSKEFLNNVAPYSIEFGRSVVNKDSFFEKKTGQSLYVVWMGLAILIEEYYHKKRPNGKDPIIKYFFGKFSLQKKLYCDESLDLMFQYFEKYYGASEKEKDYVVAKNEFSTKINYAYDYFEGLNLVNARNKLFSYLERQNESIPKLAFHYAKLVGMSVWKPVWNQYLDSWEIAMLTDISKIKPRIVEMFLGDYKSQNHPVFKDI